ncbi:MAG TPA: carbon monoxide dehydrogenase [Alphaproteobacteria bacterium]|nr:carbon monoxide dehydrogenase [Alphaproteobacteria bacterium]
MDMTGEYRIAAPRERVWLALNDPEVLRKSIPGCDELTKLSDTEMEAGATVSLGPVKARFKGKVSLSDLNPPESYTLTGEGQGGAAGFAKGQARVLLRADGDATIMTYSVNASIGGKLAQLGQRLIDGAAKKMADDFFARFADLAGGSVPQTKTASLQQSNEAANRRKAEIPVTNPPLWVPLAIAAGCGLIILLTSFA